MTKGGETSKLESDVVRVKARYTRVTSQLTGGALDSMNRALVASPRRIYGATPVVMVAEEKGSHGSVSPFPGQEVVDDLSRVLDEAQGYVGQRGSDARCGRGGNGSCCVVACGRGSAR
jgi:hypothetical protein